MAAKRKVGVPKPIPSRVNADDKSRQNPVFKSVTGYGKNLFKEAKDFGRAYTDASNAMNAVGPGTDAIANKKSQKQTKEFGQFMGALLQGRRYR